MATKAIEKTIKGMFKFSLKVTPSDIEVNSPPPRYAD